MKKMKWLRRALTAIKRNPAKTAILLLLVFVLGNVIATAVSVKQAVNVTEKSIYKRANTIAVVDFDYDRIQREIREGKYSIEEGMKIQCDPNNWSMPEIYAQIGAMPYVEYYDYTYNSLLSASDMEAYVKDTEKELSCVQSDVGAPWIKLKGTQLMEPVDFKTNMLKIVEGRLFSKEEVENGDHVIVISKELADLNNLKAGSKIVRQGNIYKTAEDGYNYEKIAESHSWEYEVIGIFEIVNKTNSAQGSDSEIYNLTYTTNLSMEKVSEWYEEMQTKYKSEITMEPQYVQYENYFVLKSPDDVEAFKAEAEQYLPPYNKITVTSDFYESLAAPLESMKSIASTVLYASIGASVLILGLTVTLFLRDRRHEIGIYMSLGEKKIKILLQIVSEVLIVAVIGMTLSMFTGNIISSAVSEKIISEQVTAQQEELDRLAYESLAENTSSILNRMGYSKLVNGEYIIDNYSVSLTADVVLIFYAVGLATVVLATSLPLIYVMRLKPKKVLMMEN